MATYQKYDISWWRTSFGEEEVAKLRESVAEEHISQGPVTEQFEDQLAMALNVPYAVATTSGSVSLLLSLMALGVGQGDEVIIPDRTWIATAHAAHILGAKVVLVDVNPEIPTMDLAQLKKKISPRTKAIMPVHLNGRGPDAAEIQSIAQERGIFVIEDACQALFSRNSKGFLGTFSDAGCFSLGVGKLISTGQGGFVITKSQTMYKALNLSRNHGVVDNFTDTWNQVGFNFKFTDLLASFGVVQLSRAAARIAHVHQIYRRYESAINELEYPFLKLIPVDASSGEVPLFVEALCSERAQLMAFLASQGIQTRQLPPSLHTSDYLANSGSFPNSEVFAEQGMYLPCGPEQPLENVERVIEALNLYGKQRTARQ